MMTIYERAMLKQDILEKAETILNDNKDKTFSNCMMIIEKMIHDDYEVVMVEDVASVMDISARKYNDIQRGM